MFISGLLVYFVEIYWLIGLLDIVVHCYSLLFINAFWMYWACPR